MHCGSCTLVEKDGRQVNMEDISCYDLIFKVYNYVVYDMAFLSCFCKPDPRALWEDGALELANEIVHCSGYKCKPYDH